MGFRDLKCRNGAQNRNLCEKLSKTGLVEKFWLWSKSTVKVNSQSQRSTDDMCWRGNVTSPRADVAGREVAAGVCGTCGTWVRVDWRVGARGRYWRRVAVRGTSAHEAETSAGAWRRVWCSFWPFLVGFCSGWTVLSSMPVLWQLNAQNVDIWVLQYCGRDGGGSLLTVTTGWRRGQRKNVGDVHRNQKVRGMALIPC